MKTLFIQAKNKEQDQYLVHPPYGLLYLASVLRRQNIEVKIYDANIRNLCSTNDYLREILGIINEWKPDMVGFGGMVSSFKFIRSLAQSLKVQYPHLPLIGGGLVISSAPEVVMKNTCLDVGCIGEAEEIIVELVQKIIQKESLKHIPGLVLKQSNSELLFTGESHLAAKGRRKRTLKDLDTIPLPSYDLIDLKQYLPYQTFCADSLKEHFQRNKLDVKQISHITPYAMPIFAGRGCPFNCIFCFSTMDKTPIKHSVDYVLRHIEYLETNYGINHFQFLDENFNFQGEWVREFCRRVIAKGNKYYFTTGNRNRVGYFSKELLELMKEAHFYYVSVGVEALDDKILKEMNRGLTTDKIIESLKLIKTVGIDPEHIRCLFGFPSDSKESIYNTIKNGNALGYKTLFALVMPLPGTQLYRYCLSKGLIKDELAYLEEIYNSNGYRNMTSLPSLTEVQNLIDEANHYSELDYCLRHRQYKHYLKLYLIFNVKGPLIKLLDRWHLKTPIKKFLKAFRPSHVPSKGDPSKKANI